MDVLKYFYEEPAALEVLADDADPDARGRAAPAASLDAFLAGPRYHRGYLAGTRLAPLRVGLTALGDPEAWRAPLLDALGDHGWHAAEPDGALRPLAPGALRAALTAPPPLLVASDAPVPAALAGGVVAGPDRRRSLAALRPLLDVARVVLLPEPAHDGHDWSLFSATPLRERFEAALRRRPRPDVRRFVLPFQRARSEERFYFEQYDLARFADFEV